MNRTLYSSLLVAVVALVGCGDDPAAGSGSNSAAKGSATTKASSSAPAASSTAAPATTGDAAATGSAAAGGALAKSCEVYLAKLKGCMEKADAAAKPGLEMMDKNMRDTWGKLPADQQELACKTALDGFATANPTCK